MPEIDKVFLDPKRILRVAIQRELTRAELCQEAGVSRTSIACAFSGRPLGIRVARQITRALGVRITDVEMDEATEAIGAK